LFATHVSKTNSPSLTEKLAFNTYVTVCPPGPDAVLDNIFEKHPFGCVNIEFGANYMC
jgi:hypothetical protein